MASNNSNDGSLKIGLNAFLVSAGIILALMIVSGILTRVLPSGAYDRVVEQGRTLVVNGSYHHIPKPSYPVWRWFTAPFEIFAAEGNLALITIIVFIICVSGSITILEKAGVMEDLIRRLVKRFETNRYALIAVLIFFFMAVSSFLGVYEGMVPMIVFIVPLALSLGWDSLTGLGMSLLPLSFGFASAVTNPFTIAVAQKIAGLPLFSGAWLRLIFFAVVYGIVTWYVINHARKVGADPRRSPTFEKDEELRRGLGIEVLNGTTGTATVALAAGDGANSRGLRRALVWFAACVGIALVVVFLSGQVPAMSDLSFPVMGLLFLVGGIGGGILAGLRPGKMAAIFFRGNLNILPGIVLIMMAYSVKHIIVSGQIIDTILYGATSAIRQAAAYGSALLVYAVTLVMNFFIGSASAKAFLMMPILTPLADLVGITRQTAVLAFDFGDGFSNMIFPTNALLLIALSFTVVSYPRWMGWTFRLQLVMLVLTSLFLAFAVAIRFGPF
ncbi:MAG TPA: hypothetical protein VMW87_06875 [Spirochaetia bacterium]|nr:hypothetical protein [Spirochaetia bacterium]